MLTAFHFSKNILYFRIHKLKTSISPLPSWVLFVKKILLISEVHPLPSPLGSICWRCHNRARQVQSASLKVCSRQLHILMLEFEHLFSSGKKRWFGKGTIKVLINVNRIWHFFSQGRKLWVCTRQLHILMLGFENLFSSEKAKMIWQGLHQTTAPDNF